MHARLQVHASTLFASFILSIYRWVCLPFCPYADLFVCEDHADLVVTTLSKSMSDLLAVKPSDAQAQQAVQPEEAWTSAVDGLVATINSDSYVLASVKQLAPDEQFHAFKHTTETHVAMIGDLRPLPDIILEKGAGSECVEKISKYLHSDSSLDELFKPNPQAVATWTKVKTSVATKVGANVKAQVTALVSNHQFQVMMKVAWGLREIPKDATMQHTAKKILTCTLMPRNVNSVLIAIPDSAFVQMQGRIASLIISHNATGAQPPSKVHSFKHHDGRTIAVSFADMECAGTLARYARMLCSATEQTSSEDVRTYGDDPIPNIFQQALSQLSNAAHFTKDILEYENMEENLNEMFRTTTSNLFVSYAAWLSKIVDNHMASINGPAQAVLQELKADEVFAKIEALVGPEHFDQATELLKEVQTLRKKSCAAELLDHDAFYNEIQEQTKQINGAITTHWAQVSSNVPCAAAVKLPAGATAIMQKIVKHICLFSFEQNYNRTLKKDESRKSRVEALLFLS